LKEFPELALVDDNLESLCAACHNKVHPEKNFVKVVDKKELITPERW